MDLYWMTRGLTEDEMTILRGLLLLLDPAAQRDTSVLTIAAIIRSVNSPGQMVAIGGLSPADIVGTLRAYEEDTGIEVLDKFQISLGDRPWLRYTLTEQPDEDWQPVYDFV